MAVVTRKLLVRPTYPVLPGPSWLLLRVTYWADGLVTSCKRAFHVCMQLEASNEDNIQDIVTMKLHDKALQSISGLEHCANLRSLDLSFNKVKVIEGCAACAHARPPHVQRPSRPSATLRAMGRRLPLAYMMARR